MEEQVVTALEQDAPQEAAEEVQNPVEDAGESPKERIQEEAPAEDAGESAMEAAQPEDAEERSENETETEATVKPRKKAGIIAAVAGCVVLLAALAVAVFYGVNGGFVSRPNDVTYKDSYTVDDAQMEKAAGKTVATIGGEKLTNGQLQVFYWIQVYDFLSYWGGYASFMGLDYTLPLDTQNSTEENETWQQYFLELALDNYHRYQALSLLAEENGFILDEELQASLDAMPEQLEAQALEYGYDSAEDMIQTEMGAGCTVADYMAYLELSYKGYQYFAAEFEKLDPTAEEIDAYFTEHEEDFATGYGVTRDSAPVVDVRHILIMPQGGTTDEDGNVTYSEDEWEECKASAQAVLEEWLAGDASEDSFAELAGLYSQDDGSSANGGLYSNVTEDTEFVQEFLDWCFEDGRQVGDYGLIQTVFGYHIMYLSDSQEAWYAYAQSSLLTERSNEMLDQIMEDYPMKVSYKNISLGEVSLG